MQTDDFGIEFSPISVPIALRVADVAAARAQLEAQGVEFVAPTIDSGVCHQAIFKDPDGNMLDLHHRYAPERAGKATALMRFERQLAIGRRTGPSPRCAR